MVVVDGVYRGDLVVGYEELGSIPTSDIVTRVHEGALDCTRITAAALPEIMDEADCSECSCYNSLRAIGRDQLLHCYSGSDGAFSNSGRIWMRDLS